jgi:hypothetical protein
MNRIKCSLLLAITMTPTVRVSAQVPAPPAATTLAANPKDVASADAIIAALYDANTVMVDQKRDTDRFRSLFAPGARLMPTVRLSSDNARLTTLSVDDYVQSASRGQPRGGFSEREIARTSETFGNIMQVFSTYETHRNKDDQHPTRGINSIQLFNDGARWWVVTVLWSNERPDTPIPAVYLKPRDKAP